MTKVTLMAMAGSLVNQFTSDFMREDFGRIGSSYVSSGWAQGRLLECLVSFQPKNNGVRTEVGLRSTNFKDLRSGLEIVLWILHGGFDSSGTCISYQVWHLELDRGVNGELCGFR